MGTEIEKPLVGWMKDWAGLASGWLKKGNDLASRSIGSKRREKEGGMKMNE